MVLCDSLINMITPEELSRPVEIPNLQDKSVLIKEKLGLISWPNLDQERIDCITHEKISALLVQKH